MQVTRDIVRDLLPVYLAGEASADTRAVVEKHLATDPQLREAVEAAGAWSPPPIEAPASRRNAHWSLPGVCWGARISG